MKTPSISQADKQPCGKECRWLSRHETTKRGQLVRVGTYSGDNDPLVLSAPHVDLLPVSGCASPIGFPLSHVLVPVSFPTIGWWRSFRFDCDPFHLIDRSMAAFSVSCLSSNCELSRFITVTTSLLNNET